MLKEISLVGKTALITGGGTGIGFGIAQEMIDAGANVIIAARREEKLKEAKEKLGEKCTYYTFDVTDFAAIKPFVEKIEETTPIDILVSNAGVNIKKDFFEYTEEEFDKVIYTQGKGPILLAQAVGERMKARGNGSIILISSLSARLGMPGIQAYTFCKTGMVGLARSLARDLGPYGVRVNSLNPGFVDTDMVRAANVKDPVRMEKIQAATPMGGYASPNDLGMAAVFLASDASRFITGIDLPVDGGLGSVLIL